MATFPIEVLVLIRCLDQIKELRTNQQEHAELLSYQVMPTGSDNELQVLACIGRHHDPLTLRCWPEADDHSRGTCELQLANAGQIWKFRWFDPTDLRPDGTVTAVEVIPL